MKKPIVRRTPLKRKKPLKRQKLFRGGFVPWGEPFTKIKHVQYPNPGPIGSPLKPRKPLLKVSKKRAALNKLYAAAKREWRAAHSGFCEMQFADPERTFRTHTIDSPLHVSPSFTCHRRPDKNPHHRKKRGPYLCDISTFMALCPADHRWVHEHENLARKLGYLLV